MLDASTQPPRGPKRWAAATAWFSFGGVNGVWATLALALAGTGAALALYHRPSGTGFFAGTHPARVGLHVAMERVLVWGHRALAAGVVAAFGLWFWRRCRLHEHKLATLPWGWALVVLAALVTAFVAPWEAYLPWSDAATVTDLLPTLQSEAEGPFSELMGLRARYPQSPGDAAWPSHFRSHWGAVCAWVHMLLGPASLVVALVFGRSQRSFKP